MLIDEIHDMPGHLIRRAHQISGASFAANVAGYDLTSVQYAALVVIDETPEIDATRLSDLIAFDRATMGGVLDRLEAKALVVRAPSKQDRRVKTVALTSAGKSLLSVVEQRVRQAQKDMLMRLSPTEQRQLIRLLKRMIDDGTA